MGGVSCGLLLDRTGAGEEGGSEGAVGEGGRRVDE
jgi:hypothetical protein